MLAGIDWESLTPAAAFIAGAIFATIGVLRVVRAVAVMFSNQPARSRTIRSKRLDELDDVSTSPDD